MKKVAILGSGVVGETLANGFLAHGYAAMRGSREPSKLAAWKQSSKGGETGTFEDATKWADIVVLAVKGTAAGAVVKAITPHISGKTVIDTTNPIAEAPPKNGVIQYFTAQNESLMQQLQTAAPDAHFVKAFNSVGNVLMVNPKLSSPPTMFICGNNAGAKTATTEILTQFGWETLDCGSVEAAGPIESLCALWCIPGMLRNEWVHAFKMVYPTK